MATIHIGDPLRGKAVDLSHHLSDLARARVNSPLNKLFKYWEEPNLIIMAAGLPDPEYFPFSSVSSETLSFASLLEKNSMSRQHFPPENKTITICNETIATKDFNLTTALQYGPVTGLPQLIEFQTNLSAKVFQPAYDNFTTLIHTGNTDGWNRCVMALLNKGEGILVGEWTYPAALATATPLGVSPVPITIDGQGIRSDHLRQVLSGWDENARRMPRPHVMYIIPVGQNPSGATMGFERKKEIYAICVEFDIIIVEDDPYYFLQQGPYVPKTDRVEDQIEISANLEAYIANLVPSFLKIDYQGRVIRLDTFSKTVAPGSRLGWFTCNPMFAERLERFAEISTEGPSGFSQSLITKLLLTWKYEGYMKWVQALSQKYKAKRDFFLDCLADEFNFQIVSAGEGNTWAGSNIYLASEKLNLRDGVQTIEKVPVMRRTLFSFVPPSSGMFIWMRLHFDNHPAVGLHDVNSLELQLWELLAESGVLFAPGSIFSAGRESDKTEGYFRISFSQTKFQDMKTATSILAKVITDFFRNFV
ncbi:hypothetical protein PILCRDRAFT_627766 [Piloderma croceum F 1598]|uniref:Aminotransferase class I/classII large domain-containing protein n=1 Tax=Piloderma croceum (strain F 1598) TaxID=765440 RepID=A0A0C3EX91_PILCF|nr:hypothetical protein PILCRDRAFT_627766 [Piloderma croceum F 1598]